MTQALPYVGAAIGAWFGGPQGAQWGYMAGSLLGAVAGGGKTTRNSQPLMDLKILGTDYGQPIPYARGTIPIAGQVWWNSDRQPIYNTTSQKQGKGGGQKVENTTITYKVDLLIGLTDIPIAGITRIWDTASGKLIYHVADDAPVASMVASGATSEWDRLTVYTGAADQTPDPTYAAAVTYAPAYRGYGTVFIQGLNLGQSGQMRNLLFEVVVDGASSGVVEREWGGMGTNVLFGAYQEIAFDPARNELWTNYVSAASNGVGTTGVVAVYNIANETWTFIDPPAGYKLDAGTDASVSALIAYDKFYTQVTESPSGIRTTAVYDLASKTLLGTIQDRLSIMYPSSVFLSAIDSVNDRMLLNKPDQTFHIHTVGDGWPNTLFTSTAAIGASPYVVAADNNGAYWVTRADATDVMSKISIAGVVTNHTLGGTIKPVTGHHTGSLVFDSTRNCLYFFSTHDTYAYLYRLDCDDATVTTVNSTPFETVDQTQPDCWLAAVIGYDAQNDRIVLKRGYEYGGSGDYRVGYMNPDTGEVEQSIEISDDATDWGGANVPAYGGFVWGLARHDDDAPDIAGFAEIRFATLADNPPTVQEVVRDLCYRAGLSADQFDVTELSTITRRVKCLPVSQVSNVANIIDLLSGVYFFDVTCDDKIRFFPRGGASVATISYEELGADEPGRKGSGDPFPLGERSDIEIPSQILVSFSNIDKDYEQDTQPSDRLTSVLDNTVEKVDIQIGFSPDEGKLIADAMLLDQSASRWGAPVSMLGHHCLIQPGDVVTVTMQDGSSIRMRSTRMRDAFPVMRHDLVLDEPSALDSVGLTALDYTSSTVVAAPISTSIQILDVPILRDSDDDLGLYVAAKQTAGDDFPGAAIFDSSDDSTFVRQATVLEAAVFGSCSTTLGNWDGPRIIDERNSVTVSVGAGTLSSSTRDIVLNSRSVNAALVGDEIIQFVTATLVSEGVYTLSRLIRGCRGTEHAMSGHGSAERFVLLQEDGIRRVDVENAQLGIERFYKGVTLGRSVSSATSQAFTPMAIGKKPFSPVDLRGSRDGSNNLTVTWQRRTRLSTRTIGALGISIPIGESEERYEIDILDDASDPSVLRTIDATSPTAEYTAAEQTADGLTPGDPVEVRVYQISATVGRGHVLEGIV